MSSPLASTLEITSQATVYLPSVLVREDSSRISASGEYNSECSSPLTQMLPPPVPSSPATPIATKGYNPIIRDLSSTEFESPTHVGSLVADDMPMSTPQPKLTPESGCADPERRLSRPLNGTIPIYLMLNNSSSGWSLTHMDPERTPSPPIGAPHSSWAVRPDVRAKREEFRGLREPETQNAKGKTEKYEQNGPASRTRARVNGGAAANNKGKGRV
ncbi:hypothetical protein FRC11_004732 [Ceratobasidium sp. 423]|nr:hypothetical protein FRC11_004732 [Ceratobasidium sp. 423]